MNTNTLQRLCCMLLLCCANAAFAQVSKVPKGQVSIIPLPVQVTEKAGSFLLTSKTVLVANNESDKTAAALFNEWLKPLTGYALPIRENGAANSIILETGHDTTHREGYTLTVDKNRIKVRGYDPAGTFYGIQTLIQLLPIEKAMAMQVPAVYILDYPRFAYRGMMLDVSRHMFPVDFIKKYIDLLSMQKMNTFHWHLTDDQGWRIEIKRYPRLQEVASQRKETSVGHYRDGKYDGTPYGGYYTQDQVKAVVQYAADRHVTVIPEIEMPGHAQAALAAYPYLGCTGGPYETATHWGVLHDVYCAGNDSVFTFLENVLDEVLPLFPSTYVHIGGDECPKDRWEKCPKCQARIKAEGLKDEHALQSYFVQRIEKYLNSKGKQIIGWDEILEGGLAPNATVMSWRGIEGGIAAARQHHNVIMTPGKYLYIDHAQSIDKDEPLSIGGFLPVGQVYSYDPVPTDSLQPDEYHYIIGAQANLWTEYIPTTDYAEYMAYPRACAVAEVAWTQPDRKHYDDFLKRLKVHAARLDLKNVHYAKHVLDPTAPKPVVKN
ncbi:hexosaminidase [Chitinophaga costaii]|uniref:beta-N-acetylhexosaminidase n=1 Tax=Chitinophaga costaii TaxID=1335309 RepID=A0A1C4D9H7_9BACT|nr:beta-N-acetylhexosaminidase [Chitinophaga costaii]SCC28003.1 hexosaminidase [Chitinophaga costaii]